jgi:hypothetical protein
LRDFPGPPYKPAHNLSVLKKNAVKRIPEKNLVYAANGCTEQEYLGNHGLFLELGKALWLDRGEGLEIARDR